MTRKPSAEGQANTMARPKGLILNQAKYLLFSGIMKKANLFPEKIDGSFYSNIDAYRGIRTTNRNFIMNSIELLSELFFED
jgi:hypothetical protein